MPRTIDLGRALLALGAALLVASLFVEWYDDGLTAWEAFEALDLVLLVLAGAALVLALWPDGLRARRVSAWAAAIPAAVLLVVVVQLINPPPAAAGAHPSTGAWLALGAGLLMLAGATLALARVAVKIEVAERRIRHRTSAVDRRAGDDAETPPPTSRRSAARRADPPEADPQSIERTQPLHALPDEDEEPDRP